MQSVSEAPVREKRIRTLELCTIKGQFEVEASRFFTMRGDTLTLKLSSFECRRTDTMCPRACLRTCVRVHGQACGRAGGRSGGRAGEEGAGAPACEAFLSEARHRLSACRHPGACRLSCAGEAPDDGTSVPERGCIVNQGQRAHELHSGGQRSALA